MNLRFRIAVTLLLLVVLNGCKCAPIVKRGQYQENRIRHYKTQTTLVKRYTELLTVELEDKSSTNLTVLASNEVAMLFKTICDEHANIRGLSEYNQEVSHLNGDVILRLAEPANDETVFEDASWTPLYVDYLGYTNNVARYKDFILAFPSDWSEAPASDIK